MLSRRVGKAFGHGYQARTQIYIGILFLWSIVAMMVMNLLYWSGAHHNFATVAFILLTVTVVAIVVLTAVSEATKLQDLVCNHRMLIKNEVRIRWRGKGVGGIRLRLRLLTMRASPCLHPRCISLVGKILPTLVS